MVSETAAFYIAHFCAQVQVSGFVGGGTFREQQVRKSCLGRALGQGGSENLIFQRAGHFITTVD